jgi:hypothetical protein
MAKGDKPCGAKENIESHCVETEDDDTCKKMGVMGSGIYGKDAEKEKEINDPG